MLINPQTTAHIYSIIKQCLNELEKPHVLRKFNANEKIYELFMKDEFERDAIINTFKVVPANEREIIFNAINKSLNKWYVDKCLEIPAHILEVVKQLQVANEQQINLEAACETFGVSSLVRSRSTFHI